MQTVVQGTAGKPSIRRFTWRRLALVVVLMMGPLLINLGLTLASIGNARAMGWATVPLMVVMAGTAHLLLRQRGPRHLGWYGVLVAYLYFGLLNAVTFSAEDRSMKAAMAEMLKTLHAATQSTQTTLASPVVMPGGLPAAAIPLPTRQAFQGFASRTMALRQDYEQRLASLGISKLLQLDQLKQDVDLSQHQAALDQARSAPTELLKAHAQSLDTLKRDIEALDVNPLTRHQTLQTIDVFAQGSMRGLEITAANEARALDAIGKVVSFLRADMKAWHLADDGFVFHNTAASQAFDAHMAELKKVAASAETEPLPKLSQR